MATQKTATRHGTVSSPVGHAVHRPMQAPAKAGQTVDEAKSKAPPQKKRGGRPGPRKSRKLLEQAMGGALFTPLGQIHQPERQGTAGATAKILRSPTNAPPRRATRQPGETMGSTDRAHRQETGRRPRPAGQGAPARERGPQRPLGQHPARRRTTPDRLTPVLRRGRGE